MGTYNILPVKALHPSLVQYYWQRLKMHDLLKYRFSDIQDPEWGDVLRVIVNEYNHMFFVVDGDDLLAEFTLENFIGRVAQVHFSFKPELPTLQKLATAKSVTDEVLSEWRQAGNPGQPYIKAMYGLTPTENKPACKFVKKVGFEEVGILPYGAKYLGGISDAMITIKTGETHG